MSINDIKKNKLKSLSSSIVENIRPWRLGAFLVICIFLGGTSQNIVQPKTIIYLVSLFLIGVTLSETNHKPFKALLRPPIIIGGGFVLAFSAYSVPLPPSIWVSLPGRDVVVEGFRLIEKPLPWMPLSVTPEITLFSLLDFLPLIAVSLILTLSAQRDEIENSYYAIVGLAIASVVLGVFQVFIQAKAFYFYDITNEGFAVGFFSNANHNATFLTMMFPIALYLVFHTASGRKTKIKDKPFGLIAAVLIAIGVLMTGSTAGYLLLIFVVFSSTIAIFRKTVWQPRILAIICFVTLLIALDLFLFGGQLQQFLSKFTADSDTSRSVAFSTTWEASQDFRIFGSGPGSFEDVYKLYEDRGSITLKFLPHAHNDYLQIWLEMGVIGGLIILAAMLWFIITAVGVLRKANTTNVINTIFVIILLVAILHSTADYPLRTLGVSTLFCYIMLLLDKACHTS